MTTVIFILGLAAITAGAGLIYLPAGLIVGGLMLVAAAALYERNAPTPPEVEAA